MYTKALTAGLTLLFGLVGACAAQSNSDSPFVVYRASDEFEWVKNSVKEAITERGLTISAELHLQEMLARTAQDLGFDDTPYLQAESIEFCSALMSHRMSRADPRNLVVCPFVVSVYIAAAEPEQVYVAFRKPTLLGDASEVSAAVLAMLDDIARTAAE